MAARAARPVALTKVDERVEHCLMLQQQMYNDRGSFNVLWQSVAERVQPNYADFTMTWAEGQRRTNKVFDSTAVLANEHFCAALESMLAPASTRWHSLRMTDPKYWGDVEIQQWLDQVNDCLFRARYAPRANFQAQLHESFSQIGAFGNGPMLIDDIVGFGMRYRSLHLAETFGIENSAGVIDHIHREYQLTARAAIDAETRGIFDKGSVPDTIRTAADKNPTQQFTFIHAIYPNTDHRPGSYAKDEHFAFTSLQIAKDQKRLLKDKGYATQPILLPRYRVAPKETYGRGPGVDVLPEILMLNEMDKGFIRQAQRAIEPPILLADDGSLNAFNLRGNSLNYSMLSPEGRPLAVPFNSGSNFEINQAILEQKRKVVERAFLVDIFSILARQPQMTATEVLQRAQEKGQLLAPIIGRIQSELFGPMITREIDILDRAGQLPPPPQKLAKMGRVEFEVVYESEIQVVQRKSKALAVAATLQQMAPLMEIDPAVAKIFNAVRTGKIIADANGAPAGMLNTDAEMQDKEAAQAQAQQMDQLAQLAGPASSAIKNLSEAQRAAGSPAPGNIPGIPA